MGWFFAPERKPEKFKPEPVKVNFCGSCNRTQHGGNCCMQCGSFTAYWNQGAEHVSVAVERWKKLNKK